MRLAEPVEFLDLNDGESLIWRVDTWLDGSTVIHPTRPTQRHRRMHMDQRQLTEAPSHDTPIDVEVPALRLVGQRLDVPDSRRYLDTSSKTLRADLLARFTAGLELPATLRLTACGNRPMKRYSVEVLR